MYAILLLLALNSPCHPTVDIVSRLEVNHVYREDGGLCFDQLIFWIWCMETDRFQIVDWRLLEGVRRTDPIAEAKWQADHPDGPPYVPEWIGGHATPRKEKDGWASEWYDAKSRKYRRVIAASCLESWYCGDIEVLERQELPESERRRLR